MLYFQLDKPLMVNMNRNLLSSQSYRNATPVETPYWVRLAATAEADAGAAAGAGAEE